MEPQRSPVLIYSGTCGLTYPLFRHIVTAMDTHTVGQFCSLLLTLTCLAHVGAPLLTLHTLPLCNVIQDKLHQNLCRQRSLVAIGTHDLAKCQGPFTYEALPPAEINFVPLKQTQKFRADELMDVRDWGSMLGLGMGTRES